MTARSARPRSTESPTSSKARAPEGAALALQTEEFGQGALAAYTELEVERGAGAISLEATRAGREKRAEVGGAGNGTVSVEAADRDGGEIKSGHEPTLKPDYGAEFKGDVGAAPSRSRRESWTSLRDLTPQGSPWLL